MKKNLNLTNGLFFLKSFIRAYILWFTREQAYAIVQKCDDTWKNNTSF